MGNETTKAIRARRRQAAARVERLIAQADERSPIGSIRRQRIKDAVRLGQRRLKALGLARRAVTDLEQEIGAALLDLTELGLARSEAYELLGLSKAVGRRFCELAACTRPTGADFSTAANPDGVSAGDRVDGRIDEPRTGASTGRNL